MYWGYMLVALSLVFNAGWLFADTVYMKSGVIYRGTIEEIYPDKIVIAEVSGRLNLQRSGILKIVYDAEDKNLLAMGDKYFKKDRFQEALDYYEQALKVNPQSNEVKQAILKVRGVLFRKREQLQKKQVDRMKNIDQWSQTTRKHYVKPEEAVKDVEGYVEQSLGIAVNKEEEGFAVSDVVPQSPAQKLHIFRGDQVYAVNGEPVEPLSRQQLYQKLAGNGSADLNLTIERRVVILRGKKRFYEDVWAIIGAQVTQTEQGFRVSSLSREGRADLAGLRVHDIITNVEGEPALFMSLDSFGRKLKGRQGSRLSLRIRRTLKINRQ